MMLEVIATTVEEARLAEAGGAGRIELITGYAEGGLTPSIGLIEEAANAVSIPMQVMVRPHGRSFHYVDDDISTMTADIRAIHRVGRPGVGIVIGAVKGDGELDEETLKRLLDASGDLDVTFHRAFDEAADQERMFAQLAGYPQIRRVLTSGGQPSALQAIDRLRKLVALSKMSHLAVLAGGGLTVGAIAGFVRETGVREVHFGNGVRGPFGALSLVDADQIREVQSKLRTVADEVREVQSKLRTVADEVREVQSKLRTVAEEGDA